MNEFLLFVAIFIPLIIPAIVFFDNSSMSSARFSDIIDEYIKNNPKE